MKWKATPSPITIYLIKTLAAAAFVIAVPPKTARSSTMMYTFSGLGSGVLNAQTFSYANVTITSTLDTSQIVNFGNGVFVLTDTGGAKLTISDLGTTIFSATNRIFITQHSQIVGITGYNRSGTEEYILELGISGAAGSTYDLSTPIGPLSGYNLLPNGPNGPYPTSMGDFTLNSWTPSFTATIVPEPDCLTLFLLGGLAFAFALLRGQRFLVFDFRFLIGERTSVLRRASCRVRPSGRTIPAKSLS